MSCLPLEKDFANLCLAGRLSHVSCPGKIANLEHRQRYRQEEVLAEVVVIETCTARILQKHFGFFFGYRIPEIVLIKGKRLRDLCKIVEENKRFLPDGKVTGLGALKVEEICQDVDILRNFFRQIEQYSTICFFSVISEVAKRVSKKDTLEMLSGRVHGYFLTPKTIQTLCVDDRVEEIRIFPTLIEKMRNLQELEVDLPHITHIPSEVGKLASLKTVTIRADRLISFHENILGKNVTYLSISSSGLDKLPSFANSVLKNLQLHMPRLSVIPRCPSTLGVLFVESNAVTELPQWILGIPALTFHCPNLYKYHTCSEVGARERWAGNVSLPVRDELCQWLAELPPIDSSSSI